MRGFATIGWALAVVVFGSGMGPGGAIARAAEPASAPVEPAAPVAPAAPGAPPAAAAPPPAAVATPPAVVAAPPAASTAKAFPKLVKPSLNHYLQFGLAVMPGSGYRGIFPYQENIGCGVAGRRVCTSLVPFFLDVQPSFGIGRRWDLLVDLRFGISRDFTQSRQFAVAPGFRYWVDAEYNTKFFATVQMAWDSTAQHNTAIKDNDFAFRNSNGFMFEVMRNLGIYIQFGETIGFVRWLRFEIDAGVGVQARLP